MRAPPAKQIRQGGRDGQISLLSIAIVILLVAMPGYALSKYSPMIDWRLLVGVPVAVSLFTYFAYRSDKRSAAAGEWRIPEATLHLAELLGGWPGGFLAQRMYRHKTAKLSYQFSFWAIVLIHQFAALDSLMDWRLTKSALHLIESHAA